MQVFRALTTYLYLYVICNLLFSPVCQHINNVSFCPLGVGTRKLNIEYIVGVGSNFYFLIPYFCRLRCVLRKPFIVLIQIYMLRLLNLLHLIFSFVLQIPSDTLNNDVSELMTLTLAGNPIGNNLHFIWNYIITYNFHTQEE